MEAALVMSRTADVAALVQARVAPAYRLARAILLEDSDAEDVVQEASLIAWRKQSSLRDPERFEAWFDRIVINLCRDQLRRRHRVREISPAIWPEATSEPRLGTAPDIDLDRALDRLDFDHRVVVLLRFWQDRTVDDIAARLGIPAGTVKSRLHYALESMRSHLEAGDGRP